MIESSTSIPNCEFTERKDVVFTPDDSVMIANEVSGVVVDSVFKYNQWYYTVKTETGFETFPEYLLIYNNWRYDN